MKMFALFLMSAVFMLPPVYAQNWDATSSPSIISRTVKFQYGGYEFTQNLTFNRDYYEYYKNLSKNPYSLQDYKEYATEHPGKQYLVNLAGQLDVDAQTLGYTGKTLMEYLTAFVQQAIPYDYYEANSNYDHIRYPIESIIDGTGDCEDKAALLAALLNTFGFDAKLAGITNPPHIAVVVQCESCADKSYYQHNNGKKYYFIETTAPNWEIGTIPPEFSNIYFIDLAPTSRYYRYQTQLATIDNNKQKQTPQNNGQNQYNVWNNNSQERNSQQLYYNNDRSLSNSGVPKDKQFGVWDESSNEGVSRDIQFDTNDFGASSTNASVYISQNSGYIHVSTGNANVTYSSTAQGYTINVYVNSSGGTVINSGNSYISR